MSDSPSGFLDCGNNRSDSNIFVARKRYKEIMSCGRKPFSSDQDSSYDPIKENVKEHYRKELKSTPEAKPSCSFSVIRDESIKQAPSYIKEALSLCHKDVLSKFYGCGLVIPQVLEGKTVLDIGSGAGRDSFLLSKMVGEKGRVTGIDMMQEMLDVSNKYIDYHKDKFGYSQSNVEFKLGYIEKLSEVGVHDSSVDIVISNGVVNLTPDKKAVLNEARRVLKDGGEIYFSDVYADRRLSDDIKNDEELWGQCISGALWWKELVDITKEVGLSGPYLVERMAIIVTKEELKKIVGDAKFASATYRLFKVPRSDQESKEKFVATYKGSVKEHPDEFTFDIYHTFKTGEACDVSANIADIIRQSRFAEHFDVKSVDGVGAVCDAYEIADPFRGLDMDGGGLCCSTTPCCQ